VSIGALTNRQTGLIRVEPGRVNLEKLELLGELARDVAAGRVQPGEVAAQVDAIVNARDPYHPALTLLCYGVSSAAVCRFLGGGWREIVAAGFLGLLTGVLSLLFSRSKDLSFLTEPVTAAGASALAIVISNSFLPISLYETILSGIIAIVPGVIFTIAMLELATRNLMAGAARITWALLIFVELIFGVALGYQTQRLYGGVAPSAALTPLPNWTEWLALAVAPIAFAVQLKARPRHTAWIILACVLSFGGSRLGAALFDWRFSAFLGAFAASAAGGVFARTTRRPAAVVIAPAIFLLVPGTVGFGSVFQFLTQNFNQGIEAGFHMALVAISIVMGILVARVVLPDRGD
jgi:uncharacterized membrane protein YjjP (DUF1212 family)